MKKRISSNIKAVVFDVGGVLALGRNSQLKRGKIIHSGVHTDIAKKLKISLDQYMDAIDTNYALAIEGKITREKVIKILSQNLKISEDNVRKIYIWAYKKHFKQNKQLFEQVFKLRKLGYKIAVLSDQWYLSKEALMPDKYYNRFNSVIVSCDVGLRKPSIKIYKLFLNKIKLRPSEILFIDNQVWNIKPANNLGIKTILFKNNKQLFENKIWRSLF
jgi:epoxide hydrolase-like predicted phosphatase